MNTALILSGGGIKTAVVAARLSQDHQLNFLHIDFGHSSRQLERQATQRLSEKFASSKVYTFDISQAGWAELNLAAPTSGIDVRPSGAIPRESSFEPPSRPGLFTGMLALAYQQIQRIGGDKIVVGVSCFANHSHLGFTWVHGETVHLREFLHGFNIVLDTMTNAKRRVQVDAPLIHITLEEIVKLAERFQLPVSDLWSCWSSGPNPCGHCGGCVQRTQAFAQSGVSVSRRGKSELEAPVT